MCPAWASGSYQRTPREAPSSFTGTGAPSLCVVLPAGTTLQGYPSSPREGGGNRGLPRGQALFSPLEGTSTQSPGPSLPLRDESAHPAAAPSPLPASIAPAGSAPGGPHAQPRRRCVRSAQEPHPPSPNPPSRPKLKDPEPQFSGSAAPRPLLQKMVILRAKTAQLGEH